MDEQPKVSTVHQPGTPATKFTPFRDEVSQACYFWYYFTTLNADMHPQLVRGFISGSSGTYRCLNHENQEG